MKTKKYSIAAKAFVAVTVMFLFSGALFAQTVEERKGGTTTYSVAAGVVTDEYTWTIAAPTAPTSVTPAPTSGTGTTADPYVITWTADLTSIDVTWAADAAPGITSEAGQVTVQKQTTGGATCPSVVQVMDVTFWSDPSAAIDAVTSPDQTVCSADVIGGSVTIDLTGAPDAGQSGADGFDLVYNVAFSDATLTGSGSNSTAGAGTVTSDGATVTIPLPDALVNTGAVAQTYTITLSTIQDDFNDPAVAVAGEVFTITVNPVPVTGVISSSSSLTRR
ncbi:MAG: hypothetical protein ABFS10_13935 [Bacteroidota bacterium]